MNKRGRPRSPVWELFEVDETAARHPRAKCKQCDYSKGSAQLKRDLVKHVKDCTGIPAATKFEYLKDYISCDATDEDPSPTQRRDSGDCRCTCPCVCGARDSPPVTAERMHLLQLALVRFIYTAGIAFRIVDNIRFRFFVQMMCPAFKFPSRSRIAGALLAEVRGEVKDSIIGELRGAPFVCIATDGWSDQKNNGLVNFVLTSPIIKSVLWKSIRTGSNQHTTHYMYQELNACIEELIGTAN